MTTPFRALPLYLTLFLACSMPCAAQATARSGAEPAWLSLERGKRAFADKDFGAAIVQFDQAIALRRTSFNLAASRLDQALQNKAAKSGGDSIRGVLAAFAAEDFIQRDYDKLSAGRAADSRPLLETLLRERLSDSHRAFIDVLLLALEYTSVEEFADSIGTLKARVQLLARYPEAEYWKGRVFFIEGELSLAEIQYKRAYDMSPSLEIPSEIHTILYSMADLYHARSDFVAWENVMKTIVSANDGVIDQYLRDAMMSTLKDDGFDRFMTLYRLEPSYSLKANAELASFYLERGRAAAAIHAAIAVNMTLTSALATIAARDRDFSWKGLQGFLADAAKRKDLKAYMADSGLQRLLLTLADSLYIEGARASANYLWKAVASLETAPYSAVALSRLREPASAVRRSAP